ncbi:MAG: DEAD/DEAH box helicase, partial [Acidobacteriota bacterium]|nr:DEAD/DEAH box helicase [Acidobacteriota bacterium]
QVAQESWPLVRDADELHDALLTLILLPPVPDWRPYFGELVTTGRANTIERNDARFWVATERLENALASPPTALLRGWLDCTGPTTASKLAIQFRLAEADIDIALAQLEAEGQVLRGRFTPHVLSDELEWCNRRILARIHRLTIGRLRREIEPVTAADFMRFLHTWQHLAPGTQLHGVDGALQTIQQLQGYEIPAALWESQILVRRIANYQAELLDQLCMAGEVMWGRASPHPAFERLEPGRVRPTRVAPLALFLREDAHWLMTERKQEAPVLSPCAQAVYTVLEQRGASFFNELVRSTGQPGSEVEDGLWELVAAGVVTADGFENLRSLLAPSHKRTARPRHAAGRWALLRIDPAAALETEKFANQLLLRWGVLFRDLLARETLAPPWRDLLIALRRMEARGEIRGGRFISGFSGEQFARPEAVDLLRVLRRKEKRDQPPIEITPGDPLYAAGHALGCLQAPTPRSEQPLPTLPSSSFPDEIAAQYHAGQ